MALAFKPGDSVKQKVKVIEGTVVGPEVVDGDVQYKVAYVGEDGEPHERLFTEDQIEKA
jgi:hypothetical protein